MATQTIGSVATPSLVKTTLWILLATIITLVIMVACAYLWVYGYSAIIHTAGDAAFYEAYAQRASPVVAVLVAFPVFFVMGRFMRGLGARATMAALTVVAISLVLDVASQGVQRRGNRPVALLGDRSAGKRRRGRYRRLYGRPPRTNHWVAGAARMEHPVWW